MGFKPIWRVLITPIGGTAQDVSYYVSDGGQGSNVIEIQDQTTDRASTFEVNLWDHDNSGLLSKFGIGDTVEIWTDTQSSASNLQPSQSFTMGAGQTSDPVSLPVKKYGIITDTNNNHITSNVLTSTSVDGQNWTPFVPVDSWGTIQSPPYRWIRVQTTSGFTGSELLVWYWSMPKRITGIVNNKYTSQDGPNVKTLQLSGNDYTSKVMNALVTVAYTNQTPDYIIIDVLKNYFSDITYNNVQTGAPIIPYVKWNHKSGFDCFNDLAQITGWDWYVDEHKDFHWFNSLNNPASVIYSSTGTNANIVRASAKFQTDGTQMQNKITFYGGTYLSNNRTEQQTGDGYKKTFIVTYPLANQPVISVNGVSKNVGVDGVDSGKDFYYVVGKNYVRLDDSETALSSTDVLSVEYQYNVPLIEQNQVDDSISKYGLFEGAKVDASVTDRLTARAIINGILQENAYPIIYGTFDSWEPTISSGQSATVNVPDQSVNNVSMKVTQVHHQITSYDYTVSITTYGKGS